jgi:hypothetical protein
VPFDEMEEDCKRVTDVSSPTTKIRAFFRRAPSIPTLATRDPSDSRPSVLLYRSFAWSQDSLDRSPPLDDPLADFQSASSRRRSSSGMLFRDQNNNNGRTTSILWEEKIVDPKNISTGLLKRALDGE